MAEQLISQFVDRAAFEQDRKFAADQLALLEEQYERLKVARINLQGSSGAKDVSSSADTLTASIRSATAALSQQTSTIYQHTNAQRQSVTVSKTATQADRDLMNARNALTKATSEINVKLQGYNVQKAAANKAAKEEAIAALGLLDPYQKLVKQYELAAGNAKALAVEFGVNSVQAKAAAGQALTLNTQLKAIDLTVGQSQKNVGNYTNSIQKAFSGLRTLANILPGIGLSGLFLLGFEGVSKVIQTIKQFNVAIDESAKKEKIFGDVLRDVTQENIKSSTSGLVNLELLRDILNDTTKSQIERKDALRQYNSVADDANKLDLSQINNLGLINDAISRQITLIQQRALATASEKILADRAEKLLLAQEKAKEKALKQQANADLYNIQTAETAKTDVYFKTLQREGEVRNKIAADQGVKQAQAEFDAAKQIALANAAGITLQKIKKDKELGNITLQELKDRLNTEFDIYKLDQQRKINLFDKELSDEKVYYTEKFTALDNSIKAQQELILKQEEFDISAKRREAAREIQHLQEQKAGKSGAEVARINENIKIVQQNLEQEILLIKAKYADEGVKIAEDGATKRQKIVEDQLKKEEDAYKDYLETKKILEEDAAGDKRIEDRLKKQLEYDNKLLEAKEKLHEKEIDLAKQAEGVLFEFATAGFDRRNNLLEQEKDAAEKKAQAEIEAVNASTQSEQDKAAAIIIINARLQAQKEAIDRKEKENNLKKARFEQAQQIFEIGIETIKSVQSISVKAALARAEAKFLLSNPATAAYAPAALAAAAAIASEIPITLASGALSIAAVLARPLPRFRHGKNNNYEGPAIVGDGGVPEYVQTSEGIFKTPATDTLTYLGKNDIVYPNLASMMRSLAMPSLKAISDKPNNDLLNVIKQQTPLLKQIANKKELSLSATDSGMVAIHKWGARQVKYVEENTQF